MKHPPYHLRVNKAVDRQTLVDVIRVLNPIPGLCSYYSLAGPFLEDLKVMDHFFPEMRLFSLENDKHTLLRQEFHRFDSRITLLKRTLHDFIHREYEASSGEGATDIFWMDFTNFEYRHFESFQVLLRKAPIGTLIRVTLRAEPDFDLDTLEQYLAEADIEELKTSVDSKFQEIYKSILPHPAPGPFSSLEDYARMVQLMLRRAASAELDRSRSERDFLPIQSTRYNDNTQMLSVTGIICRRGSEAEYRDRLATVPHADFDWNPPTEIAIPHLSTKERLLLERHLPVASGEDAGERLSAQLEYRIAKREEDHKKELRRYAQHYREYPGFIRVSF